MWKQLTRAGVICLLFFLGHQITHPQTTEVIKTNLKEVSERLPEILQSWQVSLPSQPPSTYQETDKLVQRIFEAMITTSRFMLLSTGPNQQLQLNLKSVLNKKFGTHRQVALLLAGFLESCKIQTALAHDDQMSLVLFLTPDASDSIAWNGKNWGILSIQKEWNTYAESRQKGTQRFKTLQEEGRLQVTEIHPLWSPPQQPSIRGLITRGIEKGHQGKFDEAKKLFEWGLEFDKKNAAAYNNLGNLYLFETKLASAFDSYRKAQERDKKDGNIFLNLGIVCYLQAEETRSEKAKRDWYQHAMNYLKRAYQEIGSYEDMCYFLEIKTEGNSRYHHLLREAEALDTGDYSRNLGPPGETASQITPVYWKEYREQTDGR